MDSISLPLANILLQAFWRFETLWGSEPCHFWHNRERLTWPLSGGGELL